MYDYVIEFKIEEGMFYENRNSLDGQSFLFIIFLGHSIWK